MSPAKESIDALAITIIKTRKQIQKEIQELQPLKLAPGLIKDLCQIVEDNFKDLEI